MLPEYFLAAYLMCIFQKKVLQNNPKFEPIIDPELTEVDYGTWSGKKLAVLSRNKLWKTVQEAPSRMYFPSGEGIAQMQSRAMTSVHQAVSNSKGKCCNRQSRRCHQVDRCFGTWYASG